MSDAGKLGHDAVEDRGPGRNASADAANVLPCAPAGPPAFGERSADVDVGGSPTSLAASATKRLTSWRRGV